MSAYLDAEWLASPTDPASEALAAVGGSGTIARIVTGAPDGEARFTARVADGAVAYEPGTADDADLSLTDTYANAQAILAGDEDPNALFMRGRTKVAGSTRVLLDLLAATRTERYDEARSEVAAAL